jgi:hypothetical protein
MAVRKVIRHYGTKGMRWGVRKSRTFLTGSRSTSLLYPKGRKSAAAEGKKAVSKVVNSKPFKSMVFDKDATVLTASGRAALKKHFLGP